MTRYANPAVRGEPPWGRKKEGIEETPREAAPQVQVTFTCPDKHTMTLPFADGVTVEAWECRHCGKTALAPGAPPDAQPATLKYGPSDHHQKQFVQSRPMTEMEFLLKRRTKADLEEILAEALAQVRKSGAAR